MVLWCVSKSSFLSALANGDAEKSLKQAEQTMKACLASDVPNKAELLATLHSCIGNALLELGDTEKALESHLKDLKLAEERYVQVMCYVHTVYIRGYRSMQNLVAISIGYCQSLLTLTV